jgi:hypothetical protein
MAMKIKGGRTVMGDANTKKSQNPHPSKPKGAARKFPEGFVFPLLTL